MSTSQEEQNISQKLISTVEPFWQTHGVTGELTGVDGIRIAYGLLVHPNPKGSVVISSGRIETYLKYQEVAYDLYQQGYSVFIHDHRGQGLSDRLLVNKQVGYVARFSDYVEDLVYFVERVVKFYTQQPLLLLCHSMGSAIGALTILAQPKMFQKVVFCSPMFGIKPALPVKLANLLLGTHKLTGTAERFFWGQASYRDLNFQLNQLTHSPSRYAWFRQLYAKHPQLELGGVSGTWLTQALLAMAQIAQHSHALKLPTLILQAEKDSVVDNRQQSVVAKGLPNATLVKIPGARHELLMESDEYRNASIKLLLEFFARQD